MAEYISRQDAIDCVCKWVEKHWWFIDPVLLIKQLKSVPAIDIKHKHGKWIWRPADNGWADNICSVCGYTINEDIHVRVDYDYCPNCGAQMDKNGL